MKTVVKRVAKAFGIRGPQKYIQVSKVKVKILLLQLKKACNKTVIDFNFGRHKDSSALKSSIHLGLAALMNITFSDRYVCPPNFILYMCTMLLLVSKTFCTMSIK